jgi:hypothetical protein
MTRRGPTAWTSPPNLTTPSALINTTTQDFLWQLAYGYSSANDNTQASA